MKTCLICKKSYTIEQFLALEVPQGGAQPIVTSDETGTYLTIGRKCSCSDTLWLESKITEEETAAAKTSY